jgi:hypothetical protein
LAAAGFAASGERSWTGTTSRGFPIKVDLPLDFPYQLPKVTRPSTTANGHVAHVERSGKLCLAPESGTLVDASRPADIVQDAIDRADVILGADADEQRAEIEREYQAYWGDALPEVISICPPATPSGPVWLVEMDMAGPTTLIAPDSEAAWSWARAIGKTVERQRDAYFLRLDRVPPPPPYSKVITLRELLDLVGSVTSPDALGALKAWLGKHSLPATILLSAPLTRGGDVLVAAEIPLLRGTAATKAQNGFRPGKIPPNILVARAAGEPIRRVEVARADPGFLLPRGGAVTDLGQATIAVVGCGSVGSFTAAALAASGVGHLILVDDELFRTENIHRHVLGASHVGQKKVVALAAVLKARFPHLQVTEVPSTIEASLDSGDLSVLKADLIVMALGEENLELRLNEYLRDGPRRIHVWLDPLGVGGHVLRVGSGGHPGCYACLFRHDDTHGPMNMASLVAPNQAFQRSIGGCSGTFTPFGALDAERAGLEAAREAIAALREEAPSSSLKTWVTSKSAVADGGFRLSRRGEALADDSTTRDVNVARPDCPVCARRSP